MQIKFYKTVETQQFTLYIQQKNSYERGKTIQNTFGGFVNRLVGPCWVTHCGLTGSKSAKLVYTTANAFQMD